MAVPAFVVDRHEPHAALDEPAGEEAGPGKARLGRRAAVEGERLRRLLGEIHQLRRRGLEAVGHLVAGDPGGDLRIAVGSQTRAVEGPDNAEGVGGEPAVSAGWLADIQNRIAGIAEPRDSVHRRQESARPVGAAAADPAAGAHDDERRQLVALAPQAVGHP